MGRARGRWGRLLLSEAQLEEVLGAQDQGEQEVRGCLEAQGCQEVPECQEEDTATQDVSASICPATWEVLECPQCHQPGLGLELDLVDLVPHLFLPRVETEQPLLHLVGMMRWSQESKATLIRAHALEFPRALVAAIPRNRTSKSLSTRGGGLLSPTKCRTILTSMTKCSQIPTRLANDISISLSQCNLQKDHQCSEQGWGRLEPP